MPVRAAGKDSPVSCSASMKTPPHPGVFIKEDILEPLEFSTSKAAAVLGVRRAKARSRVRHIHVKHYRAASARQNVIRSLDGVHGIAKRRRGSF